jgi:hypothetical protein
MRELYYPKDLHSWNKMSSEIYHCTSVLVLHSCKTPAHTLPAVDWLPPVLETLKLRFATEEGQEG